MSRVSSQGYVQVRLPDHPLASRQGYVLEHRLVYWQTFGPFDPSMQVHHINEDRLDNRPENLALLTHAEHKAAHRRFDRHTVVALYRSGMTTRKVAELVGADSGHVSRILAEQGEPTRPRSYPGQPSRVGRRTK